MYQGPSPQQVDQQLKEPPGDEISNKTHALVTGASLMQSFKPINNIHTYLCGYHFYNGDMSRQLIAHHYCCHLNEEVSQCVIYDSPEKDAKLIGIEYVISKRLYEQLPEEEQKYWHSHHYEVLSGGLVAPRIPQIAETEVMKSLLNSYGKTIHTWQVDRGDRLPLGPPQLMMAFTQDGQVKKGLTESRDKLLGISTQDVIKSRQSLVPEPVHSNANAWMKGETHQLIFKRLESPLSST